MGSMHSEQVGFQGIELTREIAFPGDVRFDPDRVILQGQYRDQLSAYRAKKNWVETLTANFLLEEGHDYELSVDSRVADGLFILHCGFTSACGRYAFWRLTNEQAPEAQYLIETAHIPNSESRGDDFVSAPDLKPLVDDGTQALREIEQKARSISKILTGFRAWLYK